MDALIMSCGTGGGHNAAGRAVAEELTSRGNTVTFLDPFSLIGEKATDNVSNAYIRLVQKSPKAFGYLYSLGKAYDNLPIHSPVYWANGKLADHMRSFLEENPFDVVVMSHIYPAHILANMKRSGMAVPETILIATDYTCIPFMEEGDCDYYAIPSPDLKEEFCAQGIPEEKLLPTGIPVRPAFTETVDKNQARSHLHLSPKSTTSS